MHGVPCIHWSWLGDMCAGAWNFKNNDLQRDMQKKNERKRQQQMKRKTEKMNKRRKKKRRKNTRSKRKRKTRRKRKRRSRKRMRPPDSEENYHGMSDHRDIVTVQLRTGTKHALVHGIARKQRRRHQSLKSLQGLPQREVVPKTGKDEAGFLRHRDPFCAFFQTLCWPVDAKESDPGPPAAR